MAAELRAEDLRVDVYEHGILGVNYECEVGITHLPSGKYARASVPPCRSQIEAKAQCLKRLRQEDGGMGGES